MLVLLTTVLNIRERIYKMNRQIIYTFIILVTSFLLTNCNLSKEKDKPKTFITQKPLSIDTAEYKTIIDSLKVGELENVPDYYGGLNPKFEMANAYTRQFESNNCLNRQNLNEINDVGEYCFALVIKRNNKFILVKSDDELKQVFAPIDSEEEAISYVSIITGTYPIYDFGYINMKYLVENFEFTNALRKENGFETVTFDYDIFCCPPHKYNLTRCFVDFNGNVKVLRRYAIGINVDDNNCND